MTLSDNRVSGDNLTNNYTSAGFADKNVGNNKTVTVYGISISGPDSGNYTLSSTTANTTADITNAMLTVVADNKTRAVGQVNPPLTVTYIGFVNGEGTDQLSGAPDLNTTADTNSLPGTYPITVTAGDLSAINYSFNFVNGTLTVTPPMQGGPLAVAIHESELTLALESIPASGSTPSGPGTTSNQWWTPNWHYFNMPDSLKETLRSDGTAFTVVGDSNIVSGTLLDANGQPVYPIVISLASEAVTDDEAAQLTNYVAAGGFLFVGSSAFTRYPDGTTRSNFAMADEMGVNMINPALTNWVYDTVFSKVTDHRLVSQIPSGNAWLGDSNVLRRNRSAAGGLFVWAFVG